MEPVATKKTKIMFTVFMILVLTSLGITYYKYMVKQEFSVTTEE